MGLVSNTSVATHYAIRSTLQYYYLMWYSAFMHKLIL